MLVSYRRSILVRDRAGKVRHRIDTTNCSWCNESGVCSVCAKNAEKARAGIAKSDAKRRKL